MRFDFPSALIGFVVAMLVALVIYQLRHTLGRLRGSMQTRAGGTAKFLRTSAESRYSEELSRAANRSHIAGAQVELSDIFIEPRFIQAIKPVDLDESAHVGSVFHVVPRVHEYSAIYAPYNIPTLSIEDLRSGDRHLAILGEAGMGKSTALAIMALYANGALNLQSLDSLVEQVVEEEDKDLSEQERKERARIRQEQQERALAQLRASQERESAQKEQLKIEVRAPIDFKTLLPILVNIRDIDLNPASYKNRKSLDPAEPLVKAAIAHLGGIAAQTAPRALYNRLAAGKALVLIDGFDELGAAAWPDKLAWLQLFMESYSANFIVTSGPVEGYDALVNTGFTPLYIRPLSDPDADTLVTRWSTAWPYIAGSRRRPAPAPDDKLVKRIQTGNRGRNVLDLTLKAWTALADEEKEQGRRAGYDYYIRAHLDGGDRAGLAALAAKLADDNFGYAKKADLRAFALPDSKTTLADIAEKHSGKGSILIDVPGDAVAFRHPSLAAFLAAEDLREAPRERVAHVATLPGWRLAMPFAAAIVPVEVAVMARLTDAPDLLFDTLFEVAKWLSDAPADVGWRGEIFRRYSIALGGPSQFPLVRERAAAALVSTRDKGVSFIFRQALKAPDAGVRRLGCIGLGALGDPEVIKDIGPLLGDADADVQLAAGLALGTLNSETAIETMIAGLLDGEESLRRAVAETLAALPEGGHEILRETIRSDDMLVRRASVFGLSRIKAPWALALLYRTLLEDAQWYVRSAAEQAFREAEVAAGDGPLAHPEADSLVWLIEWAAGRGEGVPNGPNARQVLVRALQEGEPLQRAAAALTIAYLGYVPGLKPLYTALRDKDEMVRGTVYEALGLLQARLGQPLPAVA